MRRILTCNENNSNSYEESTEGGLSQDFLEDHCTKNMTKPSYDFKPKKHQKNQHPPQLLGKRFSGMLP